MSRISRFEELKWRVDNNLSQFLPDEFDVIHILTRPTGYYAEVYWMKRNTYKNWRDKRVSKKKRRIVTLTCIYFHFIVYHLVDFV